MQSSVQFNEKQLAAINGTEEHKVIIAPAGSGKTSTIIGTIHNHRKLYPEEHITAITFTRKATQELTDRIGVMPNIEISTIHSWAWRRLTELGNEFGFKVQLLEDEAIKEILKTLSKKRKQYYLNQFMLLSYVMGNYNIDVDDHIKKVYETIRIDYIKFKRANKLYDFTDLPEYLFDKLNEYDQDIHGVDALFVDEFQDIDPIQLQLFDKVICRTKCYIGDPAQCQPTGEQVMVRGGVLKDIADIEVGDSIVYYDQTQGYMSGWQKTTNVKHKLVTQKTSRPYVNDYLIHIESENGLKSAYTSGHRTYVKLNNIGDKHVVYLMCDNSYRCRVGKIAIRGTGEENAWRKKMKDEGCEKIWLLKIFNTDHEAKVEEARISYEYGIPQTCWQTDKTLWTIEDINYIYKNIDTLTRLEKCLKDFKLDIKYPLIDLSIDWSAKNHCTTNSTIQIYAINIIPEYMSCLVWGSQSSHRNKRFETIICMHKDFITEPITVYSLETESGNYVANGIVTHNCIYGFRGAVEEVFDQLDGFTTYDLNINYRSHQEILDYATTFRSTAIEEIDIGIVPTDILEIASSDIEAARGRGGNVYSIPVIGKCTNLSEPYQNCSDILVVKSLIANKNTQILCRANRQVKKLQALGIDNVSTVHQAKGLEYENVILTDFPCGSMEEINVAYVGATRAKDNLCIIDFDVLLYIICQEDIKSGKKLF